MKRLVLALMLITLALAVPAFAQESGAKNDAGGAVQSAAAPEIQYDLTPVRNPLDVEEYIPAYPLSAGDILNLSIYTPTPQQIRAAVDANGDIVVPPAGRVRVLGLTIEDAALALEKALSPFYNKVTVAISIYRFADMKVFVFGATGRAGVYKLRGGTTMLEFLQQLKLDSWGQYRRIHHYRFASFFLGRDEEAPPAAFSSQDDFGRVQSADGAVSQSAALEGDEDALAEMAARDGAEETPVDPVDFVALGELKSKNFLLRDGDVIYFRLPEKAVTVYGTTRPGVYEVLPGEGLLDIMRAAGEATPENDLRDTVIERLDETGALAYMIVDLDKYYFSEKTPPPIPLVNGDRIKVIPFANSVTVIGAVNRAGRIPYDTSFTVLDYIAAAGGGRADAQREKVFIARGKWQPGGAFDLRESVMVNCDEYMGGALLKLPPVNPGDIIYVPTKDELMKRDFASILTNITLSALAIFKK